MKSSRLLLLLGGLLLIAAIGSGDAQARVVALPSDQPLRIAPDLSAPHQGWANGDRWLRLLGRERAEGVTWYRVATARGRGWVVAKGADVRQRPPVVMPRCQRSRSTGVPSAGRLAGGVLFPARGPDHFAWNFRQQRIGGSDATRWGACGTVRAIFKAITAYRRAHPGAPPVAVGDFSRRHGGEIDGHSTHENGKQVDLYFPRRDRRHREPKTVAQVDQRLARALVRAVLAQGAKRVLIGPHINMPRSARVITWPNHDDHLHAIF